MERITTIGLDIAKSTFQVHGVDGTGEVVLRRRLMPSRVVPFFEKVAPCLVGIEACATSHHWARELRKLRHDVRLMPPSYVKPYVKRQKNDTADAEAICEAVTRGAVVNGMPLIRPSRGEDARYSDARYSPPTEQYSPPTAQRSTCRLARYREA